MKISSERRDQLRTELTFNASRSSGPGGQNVNKVNTRVELFFRVNDSLVLTPAEKLRIQDKLSKRINAKGELYLASGENRSQLKNKENVIDRFFELLEKALAIPRKRVKTKPSLSSQRKRLEEKKQHSKKKSRRKNTGFD